MSVNFADLALKIGQDIAQEESVVVDAVTFAESAWGLGMELFPYQRIALKLFYGLELDDTNIFTLTDWQGKHIGDFTEVTYVAKLVKEGRCNLSKPGKPCKEMVLAIGRRSGKTTLAGIIVAYEAYKLIKKGDPQKYYGIPAQNIIQITSLATDKKQAGLLFNEASGHFANCGFFIPYMANNTMSYIKMQTPADVQRYGSYREKKEESKATINITFNARNAKGARGSGNIVNILDEFAHFEEEGQSSAKQIYASISRTVAAFSPKDPNNKNIPIGRGEGKILMISSPLNRSGKFYELFMKAMSGDEGSKETLALQIPTWEANPSIPLDIYANDYRNDPTNFFVEFGAQFSDSTSGWIENSDDLRNCIDPNLKPQTVAPARRPHFLGFDLGLVEDNSAVAIGHLETRNDRTVIVLDLLEQIHAGEGKYAGVSRLEFEDVADWIKDLATRFNIKEGLFDQSCGIPLEQALKKRGFTQLKYGHFGKEDNSELYTNFQQMIWDKRLVLFNYPVEEDEELCGYLQELLTLQKEKLSKYKIRVSAPKRKDMHDDRSDALATMVLLASQNMSNLSLIATTNNGRSSYIAGQEPRIATYMKAFRSGSAPERTIPRMRRR